MSQPKSFERDPVTGAPAAGKAITPDGHTDGADEGGVKIPEPVAPTPQNQVAAGDVPAGMVGQAATPERKADPSLSIESINGEGRADHREGGMIGEGGS